MEEKDLVLNRAKNAEISRDFDLAIRLYKSLLANDKDNLTLLTALGNLYIKSNKDVEAIPCFKQILVHSPENIDAYSALGGICRHLKQYDKSIELLQKALEYENDNTEVLYNLGFTYKLMGKNDEAKECFHGVIAKNPTDVLAYNHLGSIYAEENNHNSAINLYKKALQIDPNHPILQYNLAKSCEAIKNDEEAIAAYEIALRAKPSWPDAVKAYTKLLLSRGKTKAAADLVERSIILNPERKSLYILLSSIYLTQDNADMAVKIMEKAEKKWSASKSVFQFLAKSYRAAGKYSEAAISITKALEIDINSIDLQFTAGKIFLYAKKPERTARILKEFHEKNIDDKRFYSLAIQYYTYIKNTEKMQAFLKKLKRDFPEYYGYFLHCARLAKKNGDFENAEKYCRDFLSANKKSASAWALLGLIQEETLNFTESLDSYETALKCDNSNYLAKKGIQSVNAKIEKQNIAKAEMEEAITEQENFNNFVIEMNGPEDAPSPKNDEDLQSIQEEDKDIFDFDIPPEENENPLVEDFIDEIGEPPDDDEFSNDEDLKNALIDAEEDEQDESIIEEKPIFRNPSVENPDTENFTPKKETVSEDKNNSDLQEEDSFNYDKPDLDTLPEKDKPKNQNKNLSGNDEPFSKDLQDSNNDTDLEKTGQENIDNDGFVPEEDSFFENDSYKEDTHNDSNSLDDTAQKNDFPHEENSDTNTDLSEEFEEENFDNSIFDDSKTSFDDLIDNQEEQDSSVRPQDNNDFPQNTRQPDFANCNFPQKQNYNPPMPSYGQGANSMPQRPYNPNLPIPQEQYGNPAYQYPPPYMEDQGEKNARLQEALEKSNENAQKAAAAAEKAWMAAQNAADIAQSLDNAEDYINSIAEGAARSAAEQAITNTEEKLKQASGKGAGQDNIFDNQTQEEYPPRSNQNISDSEETIPAVQENTETESSDKFHKPTETENRKIPVDAATQQVYEENNQETNPQHINQNTLSDENDVSQSEKKSAQTKEEESSEYKELMSQVSNMLPVIENMLENKEEAEKYKEEIALFQELRKLGEALQGDKKSEFLSGNMRMLLDYLVNRLSGKPGLLRTTAALRKTDMLADTIIESTPGSVILTGKSLAKRVLEDMKGFINYLPDEKQAIALIDKVNQVFEKL